MQQQQPVAAHYRAGSPVGASPLLGGLVGSTSDPFEKDKRGPISSTLAEARAFVQHMDAMKGGARPASLTEVSRPFTPRITRRSSPYNSAVSSSPSPPFSYPSSTGDPFPSPPDSPARFSSRPSLSNPAFGSPAMHRQGSNSSIGGGVDDDDDEPAVPQRSQAQQHPRQLKSKRSNSGEEAFAEIDASASRPDSAVSTGSGTGAGSSRPSSSSTVVVSGASRSRSASTASPNTFARRSPMPGAGTGTGTGTSTGAVAVPELVFPGSAGSDEDWRMVEQQPGEETSRPGTAAAAPMPLSRQTSGLRVGAGAVAIAPQQTSPQPSLSPSPPQQPRPPSGSPPGSSALRPRSRPNSSSSSATTDALFPASSSGGGISTSKSAVAAAPSGSSRPNSSSHPARASPSPQLGADQSNPSGGGGISVGIKAFESNAAPSTAVRPSSALFARPLDVSSAPIGDTGGAAAGSSSAATAAAVPATPILDLAALQALHASWSKSSVVDKPELLRELLTASYRSLSHAAKAAASAASTPGSSSADLTVLIGFVLSLPLGGGSDGPASKLHTLASKLVFEVSRDPRNDPGLVAILPAITTAILAKPTGERGLKALSYALGALHNLSVEGGAASLCSQPLVDSLANLLREDTYRRCLHVESEEEVAKLAMEVTGVLRNIACAPGSHKLFCSPIAAVASAGNKDASQPASSCLDILCHLTMRLSHHAALLLNLTRILSKLSLHQSCRAIMYAPSPLPSSMPPTGAAASTAVTATASPAPAPAPPAFLSCLVGALHLHHVKLSLCIRVLYILGNLTMQNDECRRAIVECVCRPAPKQDPAAAAAARPADHSPPKSSPARDAKAEKDKDADALDSSSEEMSGAEVLLTLLARSYQRDSKLRKLLASATATSSAAAAAGGSAASSAATVAAAASSKKHSTMLHENEELLVKLIRLLANLSINPSIGSRLVVDRRIGNLLRLLKYKTVESHEELVLNTVSAITNLSFYLKPASSSAAGSRPTSAAQATKDASAAAAASSPAESLLLFTPPRDVLGLLLGYLFSPNLELLSETLRALGNFSRDWSFRLLMGPSQSRAEEAVVLLIDHPDVSVVYGATGVLLNIAAHPAQQTVLFEQECSACHKLIEAMERFGGTEEHQQQEEQEPAQQTHGDEAGDDDEQSEPEWGLLSMVLKTFLNLRVPAPSAAGAPAFTAAARPLSPSCADSLVLKREVDGDVRCHLMHVLEQILARCDTESERIHEQLDAVASSDDEAEDSVALQQLLRVVGEVDTLAQQLLPACIMPAAWQDQE